VSQKAIFAGYFRNLADVARQGDAREESFYPALATMLKAVADDSGRQHVHVTTLPRPTEGGNPDFRLWNGSDRIVGYVEAKRPSEERLDDIEHSEQLRRYRATFPNLLLTNFLEFRLYRNGVRERTVLAARPLVLNQLQTAPPVERPDELSALLEHFLDFALPKTFTAESLAVELAKRTRLLRDVVRDQYDDEADDPGMLRGFFDAFREYLIGSLTPEAFADLFAQTITYGLFAARIRAGEGFNRRAAFDNIPHTIGVLRDMFRFISLGDLPEPLAWCVDDLAVADGPGILGRYYREGKGSDPIVHFYETFLAQYDPDERERHGVYYTPEPVVGYIVRSLHGLLKTTFGLHDGLASEGVTLLDPAAGTMTFVARAAQEAAAEFEVKYGSGGKADFIRQHVLRNFYALELMMAPYAVGHLKMSFFLEELGYRLGDDERMPFYLTNTLDWEELEESRLPGIAALAAESRLAGVIKKEKPVLLILGNPPYSGHSSNKGDWIRGLIDDYKQVDGGPLGEKNPKWLQDDYVKFLRYAQWKIEQAGRGVVGTDRTPRVGPCARRDDDRNRRRARRSGAGRASTRFRCETSASSGRAILAACHDTRKETPHETRIDHRTLPGWNRDCRHVVARVRPGGLHGPVRRFQPGRLQSDRRRQLGDRRRGRAGRQRQRLPGDEGVVRRLPPDPGLLGGRACQQRHLRPLRRCDERQRPQLVRGEHLRHARGPDLPHRRHRPHRGAEQRGDDRRAVEQLRHPRGRLADPGDAERVAHGRRRGHAVRRRPDRAAVRPRRREVPQRARTGPVDPAGGSIRGQGTIAATAAVVSCPAVCLAAPTSVQGPLLLPDHGRRTGAARASFGNDSVHCAVSGAGG
jgi:hypothetical protein